MAEDSGSRIVYTDTTQRMNYVPYWLQPLMRPLTRAAIHKADTKQHKVVEAPGVTHLTYCVN